MFLLLICFSLRIRHILEGDSQLIQGFRIVGGQINEVRL